MHMTEVCIADPVTSVSILVCISTCMCGGRGVGWWGVGRMGVGAGGVGGGGKT